MSVRSGGPVNGVRIAAQPDVALTVRAGLIGGLAGGVGIWIYEAIVWVGVQRLIRLGGIPAQRHRAGVREGGSELAGRASLTSSGTRFTSFSASPGACCSLSCGRISGGAAMRRHWSLCSFAAIVWIVMHLAIALVSTDHPNYLDPNGCHRRLRVASLLCRAARFGRKAAPCRRRPVDRLGGPRREEAVGGSDAVLP